MPETSNAVQPIAACSAVWEGCTLAICEGWTLAAPPTGDGVAPTCAGELPVHPKNRSEANNRTTANFFNKNHRR